MSTVEHAHDDRSRPADVIAGLMVTGALVLSGVAMGLGLILQLDARPTRYSVVAIVLALVAARMSPRHQRFALSAAIFAMVAWIVGMTLMIWTENPII